MTTSKATIFTTTACIRPLPLPPARATTYAQARNLAEKHPEHATSILRAPLASQNAEPAPRTYAQARTLAAANPERAAEILSRPLSSNPPQKVFKEVTVQVQGCITPRSPLRNAARRAPSTQPRHVIKKPAGPRSQTQRRGRSETENQFPMPLVSNKKSRPPVASPVSAGISSPPGSLQSAPLENAGSAQILVSKSDVWAQEAAVVPAVKLPARPAIYAISTQVAGGVSLAGLSEVVGVLNVGNCPALSTTAVREVSVVPGSALDGTPTLTEYNSVHASVVNGTAHSAAIVSYVDGDVFSPNIAPPSSPRVSLTSKRTESLSPAVTSSSELAPLSLEESQIHSADQDSHSAKITTSKADASSAKVPPDATSDQHTNAGSSELALDSSVGPTGAADVRLVDKQTAQASLSPSLRITPTRRKSALELASVIGAQNPGHIQMQGTPSHTTVDRLRLAIAAERAMSRRPDIAARINLAFAAASAAPDVVATPLAPSMHFVRPAPQYAFKRRTYRNNVGSTQAATIPQFVAGTFPRAPSTPYEGELLGYVEVDAW